MGLFDWLVGRASHPVPAKPFAAVPYMKWEAEGPFGKAWFVRFAFTTQPDRLEDFAFVHQALLALNDATENPKTSAGRRVRQYLNSTPRYSDSDCLEAPAEIVGTTGVWLRASKLPWRDVPADRREGERWLSPTLFRFDACRRDVRTADRVADTPAARAEQRIARLRRRTAFPVVAALVQANYELFQPGGEDELPCMVVFSHGDSVTADELHEIANRFSAVKGEIQSDPDLQAMSDMVTNETAVMYRRRRVPMRFTDGRVAYAADLWITRAFLPDGYLADRELMCL